MFIEYKNICFDDLSVDGTHFDEVWDFFSDVNRLSWQK